jgi:hypothetical protein
MPHPHHPTIDQYTKVQIQRLIRDGRWSGRLPHNGLPWSVYHSVAGDGSLRICVNGCQEWQLAVVPRHLGGLLFYVVGSDGKRYEHLLISPDSQTIGTRGEIQKRTGILYRSQYDRTKRRRVRQRQELFERLSIHANPEFTDIEFNPPNKPFHQSWSVYLHNRCAGGHADIIVKQPRNMRRRTWWKLLNKLRRCNGYGRVPVSGVTTARPS